MSSIEIDIIKGLASGMTKKELEEKLNIGKTSLTKHIAILKIKLEARTLAALIYKACLFGLLDLQSGPI